MKTFTVYAPSNDASADERAVFVKDGFAWPALFFPLVWLIYHRLWLELLAVLLLVILLELALGGLGLSEAALALAGVAFNVIFAFEANDLRRRNLERKDWRSLGLAMGRNLDEAEAAFFRAWNPHEGMPGIAQTARPPQTSYWPAPRSHRTDDDGDVIGALPARF